MLAQADRSNRRLETQLLLAARTAREPDRRAEAARSLKALQTTRETLEALSNAIRGRLPATSTLLDGMAEGPDEEQVISIRGLAEEAVFEALGVDHGEAETIVTEVERRIEGLFHMVGTA